MSTLDIILSKVTSLEKDIAAIKESVYIEGKLVNLKTASKISGLSPYELKKLPELVDKKAHGHSVYFVDKLLQLKNLNS